MPAAYPIVRYGRAIGFFVAAVVFMAAIGVTVSYWLQIQNAPFTACVRAESSELIEKGLAALDANIELGIKLSVAIVGVGGGFLLGLKSGVEMPAWMKCIFISALIFFVDAALFGAWWRLEVASAWMLTCPNLGSGQKARAAYNAAFSSFIWGLVTFVVLLSAIALTGVKRLADAEEDDDPGEKE